MAGYYPADSIEATDSRNSDHEMTCNKRRNNYKPTMQYAHCCKKPFDQGSTKPGLAPRQIFKDRTGSQNEAPRKDRVLGHREGYDGALLV